MSNAAPRALFPDEADASSDAASTPVAVDVLVDKSGRLGPLSYLVPPGMRIRRGDAVEVPFGTRVGYGIVLGPGDPGKATRAITAVYGKRVTAAELDFASRVAHEHFCEPVTIAARLAPHDGKGAPAVDAGPVLLGSVPTVSGLSTIAAKVTRRYLLCAPLVDQSAVAALEAERLSRAGQVLVLCPSVEMVASTLAHFRSGASRLDATSVPGSWKGFAHGSVRIGIGTRTAALYSAEQLAGIVVVSEDHPGHRERTQPYTNARDLALARSDSIGCPVSLIGSSPTVRGMAGKVKVHAVGSRRDWPNFVAVHTGDDDPTLPVPSAVSRMAVPGSVVVVEASARMVCRRCSQVRKVAPRSGALVFEAKSPCTQCGSSEVRQINWDATRAQWALPGTTATTVESLVPSTGLTVIVPDFDALVRRPSFAPESWALHAALDAATAAGPGGRVVLLTRAPAHPLIAALVRRDLVGHARRVWESAKREKVPPFETWVKVTTATPNPPRTGTWPGRVLGPQRRGKEWEMIVQVPRSRRAELDALIPKLRRRGKTRIELL